MAARFIIASLLEADGAAAGSLVVRCRDADMVTAALVGQARMVTPVWTLPVDVQGPQLHLIIHQGFGVVTIGKVHPDNLLILWVKVVEPPGEERCQVREKKEKGKVGRNSPIHDGKGCRLADQVLGSQDGSSVAPATCD